MKVLQITILYILVCYGLADTTKECIKVFSRSNSPALHLPLDNSAQWSCWFQARKPKSTVIIELRDIAISASPESFKFTTGGTGDWHKLTVVQPGRAVQVDGFRKSLRKHTTINLLAIQTTEDILWRTCAEGQFIVQQPETKYIHKFTTNTINTETEDNLFTFKNIQTFTEAITMKSTTEAHTFLYTEDNSSEESEADVSVTIIDGRGGRDIATVKNSNSSNLLLYITLMWFALLLLLGMVVYRVYYLKKRNRILEKGISLSLISSYNNSSVISSQRNSISTLESQGNLRRVNSYPKGSPNLNHYANTGKYYSYVEVDKDVEHYI